MWVWVWYGCGCDVEAQKLGVQGVTVLVASGDDGVATKASQGVVCGYYPDFPASCPYVTAVGATQGPESGGVEVACQSDHGAVITSGGGFSGVFATPSWQVSAVTGYFNRVAAATPSMLPSDGYNPHGRGYPDISLLGYNYKIVVNGKVARLPRRQ